MEIRLYASVFLVNEQSEVLLVQEGKDAMYGLWNLPGGHVESGESFLESAVRETKEETGLTVRPSGILNVFTAVKNDMLHCIFLAREFSGAIATSDPYILQAKWIPIASFPAMEQELLRPVKMRMLAKTFASGALTTLDLFTLEQ